MRQRVIWLVLCTAPLMAAAPITTPREGQRAPGAAATSCGGELGKPCGCMNDVVCVEPCIDCCETIPCPVEGCAK